MVVLRPVHPHETVVAVCGEEMLYLSDGFGLVRIAGAAAQFEPAFEAATRGLDRFALRPAGQPVRRRQLAGHRNETEPLSDARDLRMRAVRHPLPDQLVDAHAQMLGQLAGLRRRPLDEGGAGRAVMHAGVPL